MSIYNKAIFTTIGGLLLLLGACQKDYNYVTPPPKISLPSSTLEAWMATTPPNTFTSSFWKTANYLTVSAKDISTGLLYGDGLLNMTGTYNGLSNFNKGVDPKLTLKAAYDAQNIYVLVEWIDSTVNVSQGTWYYDGNYDPLKATENSTAWTSQKNNDKLAFAFEIASASSGTNTFSNNGCLASCHGTGSSAVMSPTTGTVDLWSWNLATSAPLGYMHDMNANSAGMSYDLGTPFFARNTTGSTDRSGPKYEWDGTDQTITLPNGTSTNLNPAIYLLNKTVMPGDAANGKLVYYGGVGKCSDGDCHGDAMYFPAQKFIAYTRLGMKNRMNDVTEMSNYWGGLSEVEKDDIVTFIRGLAGVAGNFLNKPTVGNSNADITALNNVTPAHIGNSLSDATNHHTKYQVLITRKLKTNNADDIQFDAISGKTYNFGIALMNNDGKNHIGSAKEILTFK